MIKSADEIWKNQLNRSEFDESCESVMKSIEKASKEGLRECVFNPYYKQYNAVKDEFLRHGYRFRPYGYSGGVRQDVEVICW